MGTNNPIVEKPVLLEAIQIHNEAKRTGSPIPHFIDKDGRLSYLDRRGASSGGGQYFRDLGAKLATEARRKALKTDQTPTKAMYVEAYGAENGLKLYNEEQSKLKNIYSNNDSRVNDVDHIHSMASGGVHHSRNLRSQPLADNRADGARGLSERQKRDLLLADNPQDQIRLQGPELLEIRKQQVLEKTRPRQYNGRRVVTLGSAMSGAMNAGSGSQIVDRINQNMELISPPLADVGLELL